jgi:hypothetical protein
VRLGPAGHVLDWLKGSETAVSVTALFDLPCWATLGTGRFASVDLLDTAEQLTLVLDNDRDGRRAPNVRGKRGRARNDLGLRRGKSGSFHASGLRELPGFEEVRRVLFRSDQAGFSVMISGWPEDMQVYIAKLLEPPSST